MSELQNFKESSPMTYVTFHIQKDTRISIGSCTHEYLDCCYLKNKKPVEISGEIVRKIPKCLTCARKKAGAL